MILFSIVYCIVISVLIMLPWAGYYIVQQNKVMLLQGLCDYFYSVLCYTGQVTTQYNSTKWCCCCRACVTTFTLYSVTLGRLLHSTTEQSDVVARPVWLPLLCTVLHWAGYYIVQQNKVMLLLQGLCDYLYSVQCYTGQVTT